MIEVSIRISTKDKDLSEDIIDKIKFVAARRAIGFRVEVVDRSRLIQEEE